MNLENTMLSEKSQLQKTTYYMIPFILKSRIRKSIETEKCCGYLRLGEGETEGWGVTAKEYQVW